MSAGSLDYGAAEAVADAYRQMVRAVDDAVMALTMEVAAGATDIGKTDLRDMIDGRKGRRLPTDVAAIIARRIGPGRIQDRIHEALRDMFGIANRVVEPDGPYIQRTEAALLAFGVQGWAALALCRRQANRTPLDPPKESA
jgi:hypothetical protein